MSVGFNRYMIGDSAPAFLDDAFDWYATLF